MSHSQIASFIRCASCAAALVAAAYGLSQLSLADCRCSAGRGDRSGSYAHDALLAMKYAWKHHMRYCGPVGGFYQVGDLALLGLPRRLHFSWGCQMLDDDLYRSAAEQRATSWPPGFLKEVRARAAASSGCDSAPQGRAVAHLRRGDVDPVVAGGLYRKRYTSNADYLAQLERVLASPVRGQRLQPSDVRILSPSASYEPLSDFSRRGYVLRLDGPIEAAWREMVCADVLLTARSSFSFVPAAASRARVLYQPFWHPQLPHWQTWDVGNTSWVGALARMSVLNAAAGVLPLPRPALGPLQLRAWEAAEAAARTEVRGAAATAAGPLGRRLANRSAHWERPAREARRQARQANRSERARARAEQQPTGPLGIVQRTLAIAALVGAGVLLLVCLCFVVHLCEFMSRKYRMEGYAKGKIIGAALRRGTDREPLVPPA
jgi:hypothetical protein